MSVLDELEEIASTGTFGASGFYTGSRFQGGRRGETCRNGHPYTEETTRWRRSGGKRYRACLICQRASDGFKGIYKPRAKR
jgi:hypothetical protein